MEGSTAPFLTLLKYPRLSLLLALTLPAALAHGQASFTGVYEQSFDAMPNDESLISVELTPGAPIPGADGWYTDKTILYIRDGQGDNGGIYSVGTTDSTERALGSKSGSAGDVFGLALTNDTGSTLTLLDLSFYGELWRDAQANGANPNTNRFFAGYRIGGASVSDGAVTALPAFDLVSGPGVAQALQPLDGNANRTLKSGTIDGFSLPASETFWLVFRGLGYSRDEAIFGIDDVRVTAAQPVPEPATIAALTMGAAALLRRRRKSA